MTAIEQENNILSALLLVFPGDQFAQTGAGLPVHLAQGIALAIERV